MSVKKKPLWKRALKNLIGGIVDALVAIIIFLYLLPLVFKLLLSKLGATEIPIELFTPEYYVILFTVVGLSVVSKTLKGTIFRPVLASAANMLAFIYVVSFLGAGLIHIENIRIEGLIVSATLDLGMIMIIMLAFFAIPSVIMPFITYFIQDIPNEE